MPKTETLTIDVPTELADQVRNAVGRGEYSSNDEAVSDALAAWSASRDLDTEYLRRAWQEAENSGPSIPMDEVFDRLEAKYRKLCSDGTV